MNNIVLVDESQEYVGCVSYLVRTGEIHVSWGQGATPERLKEETGESWYIWLALWYATGGKNFVAQAGEAGTAETENTGSVHERAVPEGNAP